MVTCLIKTKAAHTHSAHISIQQAHIKLFVEGELFSLELRDFEGNLIHTYTGAELARVIGTAIIRGRRTAETPRGPEYYYLGDR